MNNLTWWFDWKDNPTQQKEILVFTFESNLHDKLLNTPTDGCGSMAIMTLLFLEEERERKMSHFISSTLTIIDGFSEPTTTMV